MKYTWGSIVIICDSWVLWWWALLHWGMAIVMAVVFAFGATVVAAIHVEKSLVKYIFLKNENIPIIIVCDGWVTMKVGIEGWPSSWLSLYVVLWQPYM